MAKAKAKKTAPWPWDNLVAGASVPERRMLFEMRRICMDADFDVDELVVREGELTPEAYSRVHDIVDLLEALGVWRRLPALVNGYGFDRLPERKS